MLYSVPLYLCAGCGVYLSGDQFLTHRLAYHDGTHAPRQTVRHMRDTNNKLWKTRHSLASGIKRIETSTEHHTPNIQDS